MFGSLRRLEFLIFDIFGRGKEEKKKRGVR